MKKYFGIMLLLLLLAFDSSAQTPPPAAAPPRPRLTVSEYSERVGETSFRGCETSGSVLGGTENAGRRAGAARRQQPQSGQR